MKKIPTRTFASIAVLLSISACGSTGTTNGAADELRLLEARQAALEVREQSLTERENALKSTKVSRAAAPGGAMEKLLPPNAKAGQCFTRVWMEPQYTTSTERKLISQASERIELIPAKYKTVKKKVLIQEASTKLVTVPTTYKTVSENILVKPSRTVTEAVPAVYATETERVVDKPAHTVWKKGSGPIERVDASTGEIMCLVEVPATYKTITKKVVKTPATTRVRTIPAEYQTVSKRIVDKQAHTKTVVIPAKYGMVDITEELSPAQERRIPVAAKYTTVSSSQLSKDGEMQWREIMCETNTTPAKISQIQRALTNGGFNAGKPDGKYGPSTIRAVTAFQKAKGLPADGHLTVDTVKALGVSPR
ncbi:MAG: peptidoglycan-binding protein [Granulosicoccus sp.]